MTHLVLVGGGHAHVHVLAGLAESRPVGLELTLVSPFTRQIYSGMLPGWIAGVYSLDDCAIPIDELARRAGARFVQAECTRLDVGVRMLECSNGERLSFDWLSIDAGSATVTAGIEGLLDQLTPVRPIERFITSLQAIVDEAMAGRPGPVVFVGGGAAGVELAFALASRFAEMGFDVGGEALIRVVGKAPRPLAGLPGLLQWRAAALMRRQGIQWLGGQEVVAVNEGGVELDDGRELLARHVLLVTGAAAHAWLADSGLATDPMGFVQVSPDLTSVSHPRVFAAGDCARYASARPKSGVFAVRAGPPLAANLIRAIAGKPLKPWVPQRRALYLVSTGGAHALAAWGPFGWWGDWVWRWKDRIDRDFMLRFGGSGRSGRVQS